MSTQTSADAELVAEYAAGFVAVCCDAAVYGLLFFEWAVTLDREVDLVWLSKRTGASVLFVLNRYLMLWSYIISLPLSFQLSDQASAALSSHARCNVLGWFVTISEIFPRIVWAVFSSFRAAALSEGDLRVGLVVLAPSLAAIGLSTYTASQAVTVNLPSPLYCEFENLLPEETYNK
ncbi:hypothetical protein BV20DRAFT_1055505 [Pilatotrama ljubarskyi]|nr:hypothetical protein BV20DRAFT_1055505 [Pilatotrama ljubarskyi]